MQKSELVTSLQLLIKSTCEEDPQILSIVQNSQLEILYFKNALSNAQRLIQLYQQENKSLQRQNRILMEKTRDLDKMYRQAVRGMLDQEKYRQRQIQMQKQIQDLSKKLLNYQKTIQLLQDKLLILNLSVRKSSYEKKCSQIKTQAKTYTQTSIQTQKNSYLYLKQKQLQNCQQTLQSLQSDNKISEVSYETPKVRKKITTSTYDSSGSRITDLRNKANEIRSKNKNKNKKDEQKRTSRNKTQQAVSYQSYSEFMPSRNSSSSTNINKINNNKLDFYI